MCTGRSGVRSETPSGGLEAPKLSASKAAVDKDLFLGPEQIMTLCSRRSFLKLVPFTQAGVTIEDSCSSD